MIKKSMIFLHQKGKSHLQKKLCEGISFFFCTSDYTHDLWHIAIVHFLKPVSQLTTGKLSYKQFINDDLKHGKASF